MEPAGDALSLGEIAQPPGPAAGVTPDTVEPVDAPTPDAGEPDIPQAQPDAPQPDACQPPPLPEPELLPTPPDSGLELIAIQVTGEVRSAETVVLEIEGTLPKGSVVSWMTTGGTLTGDGPRVNFTPDAPGPITLTAQVATPTEAASLELEVEAAPPRPRIWLDPIVLPDGTLQLSGHVTELAGDPTAWEILGYQHTDIHYSVPPVVLDAAAGFDLIVPLNPLADRVTVMLVSPGLDVTQLGCTVEQCWGQTPFPIDDVDVLARGMHYVLGDAGHGDPQIRNLLGRLSTDTVGDGRLIRSFRDLDAFFLYDQAVAIVALAHAGEQGAAEQILLALDHLQRADGSWWFSYDYQGGSPWPAEGDHRPSGAIAWVVMAANAYESAFDDPGFAAMAASALDYLDARRTPVEYACIPSAPVRFAPVDSPTTPWDETRVVSLEHNLDALAAFEGYAALHDAPAYAEIANEIRQFAESMWRGNRFYAGFDLAAGSPNGVEQYLDLQSWGALALGPEWSGGLDFNCSHLFDTAGFISQVAAGVHGFFDLRVAGAEPAHRFVWTEGTAGMILALEQAAAAGEAVDCPDPAALLLHLDALADSDGGIPYATTTTNPDFSTSSSVAGTAWLYLAREGINPFALP